MTTRCPTASGQGAKQGGSLDDRAVDWRGGTSEPGPSMLGPDDDDESLVAGDAGITRLRCAGCGYLESELDAACDANDTSGHRLIPVDADGMAIVNDPAATR